MLNIIFYFIFFSFFLLIQGELWSGHVLRFTHKIYKKSNLRLDFDYQLTISTVSAIFINDFNIGWLSREITAQGKHLNIVGHFKDTD